MRRSICVTEPTVARAGEVRDWKFIFTPSTNLPKGAKLKFDLMSRGRYFDWQVPTSSLKNKTNLIWLEMPDGKKVAAETIEEEGRIVPDYEFTLPDDVPAEETLMIVCAQNAAQHHIQRRRPFQLYVDSKGKGTYKEPESFLIDIRGRELDQIKIITPSMVGKNDRFDVVLRFEDAYGNLTGNAPEGTLVELSYDQLRDNLNWKLFVPETGFISLPNLYFNESGVYRLKLYNNTSKKTYYSPPIICFDNADKNTYWGLLHGELVRFDAEDEIEACLRHCRDELAMHFYATSNFDTEDEMPAATWKTVGNHIADFNEDDRFVTFLGQQWFGDDESEGLRQIVYLKDNRPLLRKKETKSNNLKKIYKSHTTKDFISIPQFTMAKDIDSNFADYNAEYEPVVEIYNAWGSSECTEKEGNWRPISSKTSKGVSESKHGSIREALNKNFRFGFTAGGLDDRGVFHGLHGTDQMQYSPGITAVNATAQTRDAIATALQNRSCYATTGERMIIGLNIAESQMGSELTTRTKPGLAYVRYITGYVVGTTEIETVEIIRNGVLFKTFEPKDFKFEFEFDDTEMLEKISFPSEGRLPFTYYYIRARQKDGHIAWGSPIWIDLDTEIAPPKKQRKKK
ncbi:MAG: DUF3604 domain-containing protein [Simkaniaceae bacterium]|nr:DUF3604 domain-containing protein [Simkaniaceae bacterium]